MPTIRYMVSRTVRHPHRRRRIETRNGTVAVPDDIDPHTPGAIRPYVLADAVDRHGDEGWQLGGWVVLPDQGKEAK